MIVDLLRKNLIDKKTFLLKNYHLVALSEAQLVIVLLTLELSSQDGGRRVVTSSDLAQYMSLNPEEIDAEMDDLIQKSLVKITSRSIDFTTLFLSIAAEIELEDQQTTQQDFFLQIGQALDQPLSFEQIGFLNQTVNNILSPEQVLAFASQKNVNNFEELRSKINQEISKKPKALFKYNWLNG